MFTTWSYPHWSRSRRLADLSARTPRMVVSDRDADAAFLHSQIEAAQPADGARSADRLLCRDRGRRISRIWPWARGPHQRSTFVPGGHLWAASHVLRGFWARSEKKFPKVGRGTLAPQELTGAGRRVEDTPAAASNGCLA